MSVIDHSCPSCGASLIYNSSDNNWVCKFCKVEYSLDMLKGNIDKYNSISSNELDEYECSNCGAKIVTDKSTSSTTCIYCNSSVIIKSSLIGNYKPDYIVPFSNTKEDILDKFSKHLKSKLLCGKKFKDIRNITSITSLYVPYWLVSSDVLISVKGAIFGGENGNGAARRYYRLGEMKLVDVPADAKSNLDNNLLSGIMPIDYTKMTDFEYPYLAGNYAEKFDLDKEEVFKEQLKEEIRQIAAKELANTVKGYKDGKGGNIENIDIYINNLEYKYVLVPVWFVKMEYKGKVYEYCINDSTNKISGSYYVDKSITNILILLVILSALIFYLFIQIDELFIIILLYLIAMISGIYSSINGYKLKTNSRKNSIYIKPGSLKLLDSKDEGYF